MTTKKKWLSPAPTHCQLCEETLKGSFIDGRTRFGPWAIMCITCHLFDGAGLGTGHGQKYDLKTLDKLEG